jgi:hypothetical protein
MRNRNRANENEIAVFVFSVTTKHFPHDMLLSNTLTACYITPVSLTQERLGLTPIAPYQLLLLLESISARVSKRWGGRRTVPPAEPAFDRP